MAFAGLLALLDDVTAILDDVATMTKVASQKTSAIVGDDLALNANQLTGISSARELPILAQVAKGSLINKAILIPAALIISALTPFLIVPLLMIGGAFLCYEGAEKVLHKIWHKKREDSLPQPSAAPTTSETEKDKIRGAVLTDFILSAEIIIIALGVTSAASLLVQAVSLTLIGLGMTVVVYGLVAIIIKADDFGLYLLRTPQHKRNSALNHRIGRSILACAPIIMRLLSVLGTAAMFLVGGEILIHGMHTVEALIEAVTSSVREVSPAVSAVVGLVLSLLFGFLAGVIIIGAKKALSSLPAFRSVSAGK